MLDPKLDPAGEAASAWDRLGGVLTGAGYRGIVIELRLDGDGAKTLVRDQDLWGRFAARLASASRASGYPMMTTEGDEDVVALQMAALLSTRFPAMLLGRGVERRQSLDGLAGFHYLVVDMDQLGDEFAGQSVISAVRAKAGNKPVFLESSFNPAAKGIYLFSTGAAGLMPKGRGDGLPGAEETNKSSILALGMIVKQQPDARFEFLYGSLPLQVTGAVRTRQGASFLLYSGVPKRPENFTMDGGQEHVIPFWYQPDSNHTIVLPMAATATENELLLRPPSDHSWVYGRIPVNESFAAATTVTLGTDLAGVEY